jgi:GNAT superfamily N-acetyltransferase
MSLPDFLLADPPVGSRQLLIRPFTARQRDKARAIDVAAYGEFAWCHDGWDEMDVSLTTHVHVAYRGGEVVGFLAWEYRKCELRLLKIAVAKGHRHRGVGAALLYNLIDEKMASSLATYHRMTAPLTVPAKGDTQAIAACQWLAKREFRCHCEGNQLAFVYGPDEVAARKAALQNTPGVCP